ncbi:MAG: dihydroneopterin aldolase [Chlamydiota bacterium]|nr:dihydroneopterin aldolase [Chlamydiota bacterium]
MQIHIKNLRLRTIIGINQWERENKQDVIVNILVEFDGTQAALSDCIDDTIDYKKMTKKIIDLVENTQFYLVEKLADTILNMIIEDKRVEHAQVQIDKPQALRFADSVSLTVSGTNPNIKS